MTTEEKAKAYDEALEKTRPLYEQAKKDGNPIWSTYEYLIPELAESEDERMMKNIRLAILSVEDVFWRTHGLTAKEAISYLEKQKEQEHICDSAQYEEGFKTGLEIGLRKQKEQKPAWSEEDELTRISVIQTLERFGVKNYEKEINWLKSLRPSWKPSEEHLSALLAVFNDPNNIGSQTCQLALTDLYEKLKRL